MKKMFTKIRAKRGFTLIEMLIAMSIFVTFLGILMGSYSSIVKAQREANDYRVLYSEARRVFDKLTEEIRGGSILYSRQVDPPSPEFLTGNDSLTLVAADGNRAVNFVYQELGQGEGGVDGEDPIEKGTILFTEELFSEGKGTSNETYSLISNEEGKVYVSAFNVFVSPSTDPYNPENVYKDAIQFQPKVTVYARFELEGKNGKDPFILDLQTTVSSRFYTQSAIPSEDLPQIILPNLNILNNFNFNVPGVIQ